MTHESVVSGSKDVSRRIDQFYGPKKVKVLGGEHPGLDHILSVVRKDETGGEPFRRNLAVLTTIMGEKWHKDIDIEGSGESVITIAIPRGGIPMGMGLRQVLSTYSHFESNDGKNRDTTKPLLPKDFPHRSIDHVIIADTVIGTGQTIIRTVEEISRVAGVRFFHILSIVTSSFGIQEILRARPYGLRICSACIETKFEWVIKDGKPVLFVAGIGDAGELVSKP